MNHHDARVDTLIATYERFRHQVHRIATLAGFAFEMALAAVIGLVVFR